MSYRDIEDKDIILSFTVDVDSDLKMSLNKIWWWVHWGVRSTFRNIWHEEIYAIAKKEWFKMINDLIHIEYRYEFKTRYLDTSNCSVMNKAIEDWLVEAEVLHDDTPQYIESSTTIVPIMEKWDRKKMNYDRLTVTIFKLSQVPMKLKWEVIREKAKWKKRTTRWASSEKNWQVVKELKKKE